MPVPFETPGFFTQNAVFPHDSGYPVTATGDAFPLQDCVNAGVTVAFLTVLMDPPDVNQQGLVRYRTPAFLPFDPGIVASPADTQFATQ